MSQQVDALARRIIDRAQQRSQRLVVAVCGIPGSGKSTVAYPLVDTINRLCPGLPVATCIGVDGWHYSQAKMRSMENPDHLFVRRGAHFTFDAASYAAFVDSLDGEGDIPFPTFSHADKDPVVDGGVVRSHHRIIVIEGLHALLDIPPWSTAAERYDEKIWVETPLHVARQRIVHRHFADGVENSLQAARRRADESDMLNAAFLIENQIAPTIVIEVGDEVPSCAASVGGLGAVGETQAVTA